jgi:hypothetical protein
MNINGREIKFPGGIGAQEQAIFLDADSINRNHGEFLLCSVCRLAHFATKQLSKSCRKLYPIIGPII